MFQYSSSVQKFGSTALQLSILHPVDCFEMWRLLLQLIGICLRQVISFSTLGYYQHQQAVGALHCLDFILLDVFDLDCLPRV